MKAQEYPVLSRSFVEDRSEGGDQLVQALKSLITQLFGWGLEPLGDGVPESSD